VSVNPTTESPIRKYALSIIMVVVTVAQVVIGLTTDGIAQDEWLQIAASLAGAIAVYFVPNFPNWPWLKTIVGAIILGLSTAQQFIEGGITTEEWYMIGVAVLGALGLIALPKPITQPSG
jgi:uncharacterized membrane protein YccC